MKKIKFFTIFISLIALAVIPGSIAFAEKDPETAQMIKLCNEQQIANSCFKMGERYRLLEGDNATALSYFLKGCDAGHMTACTHAGILTQMSDKQYSKAWKEAAKLYQKACDAGEDPACFNMGTLKYKEGRASAARKYYKLACDMNNGPACSNLKKLQK
ncbi:MAG: tetratricopeptide repeat protein [Nitrospinales bacterium]